MHPVRPGSALMAMRLRTTGGILKLFIVIRGGLR